MATSLYDLCVPTFLQTMRAMAGFLDRASAHCAETGADPDGFVEARLHPDMAPFHFQIEAAWHHSVWGVLTLKTGDFTPPALVGPVPFAELRAMIGRGIGALEAFTPDEVNGWAGKVLNITLHRPVDENDRAWTPWAPRRHAFAPDTYILSFALPNFHFHAVTAYDVLRSRGVPIGKRDYEGRLRAGPAS